MADHTDFRSDFSDSDDDDNSDGNDTYNIGEKKDIPARIKSPPRDIPNSKAKKHYKRTNIPSLKQSSSVYDDVALVCNEDVLYIEDEKVIFLTTDKNSKIYLPKLDSENPSKTSKGSLFITKTIKIKATRLGYEHNIFSYKGNYINAGSTVYNLKGGNYVTFYAAGCIWYTMD